MNRFKTAIAVFGAAFLLTTVGSAAQSEAALAKPLVSNTSNAVPGTTDVYIVNYFRNLNLGATINSNSTTTPVTGATSPDDPVDVVNPGENGSAFGAPKNTVGDLCAMVYVFDQEEELSECCGCLITPDQLIEFSTQYNLISNPENGRIIHNGVIKIVAAAPTTTVTGNPGIATAIPPPEAGCSGVPNPVNPSPGSFQPPVATCPGQGTSQAAFCDPTAAYTPTPGLRAWITHLRTFPGTTGVAATEVAFSDSGLVPSELATLEQLCTNLGPLSGTGACTCPGLTGQ
jgi:hypothetical protein